MRIYLIVTSILTTVLPFTSSSQLIAHIPAQYTYLLPRPFNNTFTNPFIDTTVPPNTNIQSLLNTARKAPFISYTPEFDAILGPTPSIRIIANSSSPFAFEAGIWVPRNPEKYNTTTDQIWFTAFLDPTPGYLTILDLNTSRVFQPILTGPAASIPINPNGGYFHNGLVYLTSFGNGTTSPAIVTINPTTYETHELINSFYGLNLNGPDDVTLSTSPQTGNPCLFYSDFYFAAEGIPGTWQGTQQLPNAVWRLLPDQKSLSMAISTHDVQTPNGLAVNKEGTLLYVTDGPDSAVFGRAYTANSTGSPGIYVFDLAGPDGCTPLNKRLLGIARQGFANGIKIDDFGRVWTFEYEGVVVRDGGTGQVLGVINIEELLRLGGRESPDVAPGANFVIVRDRVYVLGFYHVFEIKLGSVVKSWY